MFNKPKSDEYAAASPEAKQSMDNMSINFMLEQLNLREDQLPSDSAWCAFWSFMLMKAHQAASQGNIQ